MLGSSPSVVLVAKDLEIRLPLVLPGPAAGLSSVTSLLLWTAGLCGLSEARMERAKLKCGTDTNDAVCNLHACEEP